ncbi:chitobiase/beta-hexosaminidase C-terminal domain-containing protein [Lachnoclostridium sp. An181]|uniref:chitobiase/beta-hexosaminidase C-terminal domain-containing protein n=1 Tax=Lachnoclostridium sp. An181 TaxID=1965575 RepID=UPI000B3AB0B7|nr:chitobiase/beta-hexosaminidase C-terminal domain-containing protein [Lachnoclostridium sp. An181]OUP50915.1 hypothetical protein B5F18_01765 [Lachnoclostridium sp. An181]
MKCRYCGCEIPDGYVYCERCGREVQMVPDYNPLDDILTSHVNGTSGQYNRGRVSYTYSSTRQSAASRMLEEQEREAEERETARRRRVARQRKEKRRKELKARRRKLILCMVLFVAVLILGIYLLYSNSYTGIVNRGNSALVSKNYEKAEQCFEKAIQKNGVKVDAYRGLVKVYLARGEENKAEQVYEDAVSEHPGETELYRAAIEFYMDNDELEKVSELMADCAYPEVTDALSQYVSSPPKFSLEEGDYEEVQELKLTSSGEQIYYTLDGKEPTTASTKYNKPIPLKEGTTIVKAMSVNAKGIPSSVISKSYVVQFPTQDAPAVTPSTGKYSEPTKISIIVPEGYTAYYTLDGSAPTKSSKEYTGPIDMPEGNTIFTAVLINGERTSEVTKRNYELTIER